jgi:WD40 repeat protein
VLVTGGWDHILRVWKLDTGALISETVAHTSYINSIVFDSVRILLMILSCNCVFVCVSLVS